jgi:hypothetical protein
MAMQYTSKLVKVMHHIQPKDFSQKKNLFKFEASFKARCQSTPEE